MQKFPIITQCQFTFIRIIGEQFKFNKLKGSF